MTTTEIVTAQEFKDRIWRVQSAIASLKSCLRSEARNEATILRRQVNDLCAAKLGRKNKELEIRRGMWVAQASEVLANFVEYTPEELTANLFF